LYRPSNDPIPTITHTAQFVQAQAINPIFLGTLPPKYFFSPIPSFNSHQLIRLVITSADKNLAYSPHKVQSYVVGPLSQRSVVAALRVLRYLMSWDTVFQI
jgi:hypothetical protein